MHNNIAKYSIFSDYDKCIKIMVVCLDGYISIQGWNCGVKWLNAEMFGSPSHHFNGYQDQTASNLKWVILHTAAT